MANNREVGCRCQSRHQHNSIQSLNSLAPLSVLSSSTIVSVNRAALQCDAHLVQTGLELVNFGLLD
jgi:hypothetical protein